MVDFKKRLVSLDVFRGLTMACMVLVENPGNWTIYRPLRHARWGMVGGYSIIVFAFVFWLVDVKKWKAGSPPLVAYGVNCISVYFVSHIVGSTLRVIKLGAGENAQSLHEWINLNFFESWLSPINASLAFSLIVVIFWFIPLWIMYKKHIFIKV